MAFLAGAVFVTTVMLTQAVVVWRTLGPFTVPLATLALGLFAVVGVVWSGLRPRFTRIPFRAALIQTAVGLVLGLYAYLSCFMPAGRFANYYPAFPLANIDAGILVKKDTAFHSSIINSILNFGYPSTGLHGVPFTFYYPLSHYIDAFASLLTGVSPFVIAGLLFHLKKLLLVLSVGVFVALATRGKPGWARALVFLFVLPALIADWHLIGSEGQWAATIVLLLLARRVYTLITSELLSPRGYFELSAVIVLVSFAKSSTGFMLAVIIGGTLLLTQWRTLRFWLFGGLWLSLFGALAYGISTSNTFEHPSSLNPLRPLGFLALHSSSISTGTVAGIYAAGIALVVLWLVSRDATLMRFCVAGTIGIVSLGVLSLQFGKSDIFYFSFALALMVILFGTQYAIDAVAKIRAEKGFRIAAISTAVLLIAVSLMNQSSLRPLTPRMTDFIDSFGVANSAYFAEIEGTDAHPRTFLSSLVDPVPLEVPSGKIANFVSELHTFLAQHDLTTTNTLLFVPRTVWENQLTYLNIPDWARGFVMYSATEVPLINGAKELHLGYGFRNYPADSLWTATLELDPTAGCMDGKTVVEASDFTDPQFEIVCKPAHVAG